MRCCCWCCWRVVISGVGGVGVGVSVDDGVLWGVGHRGVVNPEPGKPFDPEPAEALRHRHPAGSNKSPAAAAAAAVGNTHLELKLRTSWDGSSGIHRHELVWVQLQQTTHTLMQTELLLQMIQRVTPGALSGEVD